jgi:hypothetical protein
MPASTAISGYGTLLKRGDGATPTEAFTDIAEVKDITPVARTTDTIDVTHMTSPDATREFIPSLSDAGELAFSVSFIPGSTNHMALYDDQTDRVRRNFQVHLQSDPVQILNITGYVTGFTLNAPLEDVLSADFTVKVATAPTWSTAP